MCSVLATKSIANTLAQESQMKIPNYESVMLEKYGGG